MRSRSVKIIRIFVLTEKSNWIIVVSEVSMNWEERIEVKPGVMLGKPVIRGTRITVELILERLQAGEMVEQISNSLKTIDIDDVHSALGSIREIETALSRIPLSQKKR